MGSGGTAASGVLGERCSGEAKDCPILHWDGAEFLVEIDRRLIPIEHGPLHASATTRVGDGGEVEQQGATVTGAAVIGANEEIFEIETGFGEEGGEVEKIEGEADGLRIGEGEHAMRGGGGVVDGKELRTERGLGGSDFVGEAFVDGEFADQLENERDVGGAGRTDLKWGSHEITAEFGGQGGTKTSQTAISRTRRSAALGMGL